MPWDFNNPQHFARAAMVLVALEAEELSEGQAVALLGVDRVTVRELRQSCLDAARQMWDAHRRKYPVDV